MRLHRLVCWRCRRPAAVCYCAHLAPIASATRVVFLQHPRESRVAIGTCRMAHLALANSELHLGVTFEDHARVRALARDPGVALLFPDAGARDPASFGAAPPQTLIVVDGTWIQARKMLARNPTLAALPRIGVTPARPGNYRIRREPAPHCLATVEAVVDVLGRLEHDPERFVPMLRAFEQMVETQLVYRRLRPGAPWRRTKRQRQPRPSAEQRWLRERWDDLVLLYGEANAYARDAGVPGPAEIVQLVAVRPASGERFAAIIAPRRPLAPAVPRHLDLAAASLLAGEPIASALARWQAFVRPADVFCGWGHYGVDLLRAEQGPERPLFDLRIAVARALGRQAGGVEQAARLLDGDAAPPSWAPGRAGRRIAAMAEVLARFAAAGDGPVRTLENRQAASA